MTRILALAFACLVMIAPTAAHADAAAHYKQGKAFFEAKQYDQAIVEYQAAYAIDKLPAHLFNIGRAYQLWNNAKLALEYYQKFLAADPKSARATEARGYVVEVTRQIADEDNKRKLDEEAKAKALADQQAKAEQKRLAGEAHVKLAEAYGRASEWRQAGDEYRAAADAADDPVRLRDAGDAYAKQPDHVKAREAYLAYLAKLPRAPDSDAIRDKIAIATRAIDEQERLPNVKPVDPVATPPVVTPPPIEYDTTDQRARRSIGKKVIIGGSIALGAGLVLGAVAVKFKTDSDADCTKNGTCSPGGVDSLRAAKNVARAAEVTLSLGLVGIIAGIGIWANAPKPVAKSKITLVPTSNGAAISGSF